MAAAAKYGLGRGYASSLRLNFVHFLWKQTTGYLLPPQIPVTQETLRIADIGTGTGIWLFDLADHLPASTVFHGFDISGEQFSPPEWIPSNVHLHIWNALEDPPPQFLGFFDILHIRLFMIIVENYDPKPFLRNCRKLLKPGGFLILEEIDLSSSKIVKTNPSNNCPTLEGEESMLRNHEGIKWIGQLPNTLKLMEFEDIQVDHVVPSGWTIKMWQQQQLLVREEYTNNSAGVLFTQDKAAAERQRIGDMWREVQQGSVLGVCLQTVIARPAL